MATVTAAVIGAGLSIQASEDAKKRKRAASQELNNYNRQPLKTAYEEMPISMRGFDYAAEANAVNSASAIEAARGGGARTIAGAVPKIVAAGIDQNAELARYLDDQFNRRSMMIAGDNARIEGITENRDMQNIAGLSSQLNAAKQDEMNGLMGLGSSIAYGVRAYGARPATTTQRPMAVSALPANMSQPGVVMANTAISAPFITPTMIPTAEGNIYGDYFNNADLITKY